MRKFQDGAKRLAGPLMVIIATLAGFAAAPASANGAGSTLVPSRAEFDKSLGITPSAGAETTPQSLVTGSQCIPDFGYPYLTPSSADVAIGPTKGVIVTDLGFLVFDKSDPTSVACNPPYYLSWYSVFFGSGSGHRFSSARVVYDPHIHGFVIGVIDHATFSPDPRKFYVRLAIYTDTSGLTLLPKVELAADPDTADHLTVGYAQGYLTFAATVHSSSASVGRVFFGDDAGAATYEPPPGSFPANIVAPIVRDSSGTGYYLAADPSSGNSVTRVAVNFAANTAMTDSITVPAFSAPPAVMQYNGKMLNAGDGAFLGPSIQSGNSLWNVHTVNVGGHARFSLYKFSTTDTTPLMTFTPSTNGIDDLFNATMTTGSDAAGARAFVSASGVYGSQVTGQYALAFSGPNDSTQGWSYDVLLRSDYDVATDINGQPCPSTGCAWVRSSGIATDPASATRAWVANQYAFATEEDNWSAVTEAVSGAGTGDPPLAPIASTATDVGTDHFTANWSAQAPAVGYQLDVSTDANFATVLSGYPKDVGNVTSFEVTGLDPATTYYYRVRAVAGATSLSSNTINATTDDASAAQPVAIGPLELLALSILGLAGLGLRRRRA